MIILSIDVGIKNLAYCLLDVATTTTVEGESGELGYKILSWDSINLCGDAVKCRFFKCNKKATFTNEHKDMFFCNTHAKKAAPLYYMPQPDLTLPKLKKMKIGLLQEMATKYKLKFTAGVDDDKLTLLALFATFILEKGLTAVLTKSANSLDLISIGIAMKQEFEKRLPVQLIDKIVIENQISPIANRMKSLQGMIAQFFIMHGKTAVYFVSSANKLKAFAAEDLVAASASAVVSAVVVATPAKEKSTYAERKKLGIKATMDILGKDFVCSSWPLFFNAHTKKDDLADSFLQGLWFLQQKKYTDVKH